ncbi:MAG TPA: WYL domain-containing protein [Pirellulales bacterium]|nr:WYL domain-containing protein [Pirellulales bacterium]
MARSPGDRSTLLRQWIVLRAIAASGGKATIKALVGQTGKSEKTIRRDVSLLQRVGFPIVETTGDFGRKTFTVDATGLPRADLRYDEALALFFCRRAVRPLAGTFFWESADAAFRKIKAGLGERVAAYVDRMLGRVYQTHVGGAYADKAELIDRLLLGIEECRSTFITYHSSRSSEPLTYPIWPYGMVDHRGSLYVVGHSEQHDEVRHWKIDRVEDVDVTRVPFQRPADFDVEAHLAGSLGIYHGKGTVRVRARFTAAAARYIREKRMHASQRVTQERDGSAIAEWTLSSTVEAKSFLLSFGSAAEVLEPAELRTEIAGEIEALAEKYGVSSGRRKLSPKG